MACRALSSRTSGSGSGGATDDAVGVVELCAPEASSAPSAASSGRSEGAGFLGTETVAKPLATGFKPFFFFAMKRTMRWNTRQRVIEVSVGPDNYQELLRGRSWEKVASKLMEGRVDRIYGRYMRRSMGMRGFDGSKNASKYKAELSIERLDTW